MLTLLFALALSPAAWAQSPAPGDLEVAKAFEGVWSTTYGVMILERDGLLLEGTYSYGGASTITGAVQNGRLSFRYTEPGNVKGEGWFELSGDRQSFTGQWRQAGQSGWSEWAGARQRQAAVKALPFEGLFESPEGRIRLLQRGRAVTGIYESGGVTGSIQGTATGKRLKFRWQEGKTRGQGWLERVGNPPPGTAVLRGSWRLGRSRQSPDIHAQRVRAEPGVQWLVVLEAHWEHTLEDQEYSFGAMLRSYFRRYPRVKVRHRRFGDLPDFRRAARQLAFLAEPTILVVASHGSAGQLVAGSDRISAEAIGQALRYAANVELLHFSACEMILGKVPSRIRAGIPGRSLALSGYATSVDWSASAILEMLYFDLILGRGKTPAQAASLVRKELGFSSDSGTAGSPLGAAKFRFAP